MTESSEPAVTLDTTGLRAITVAKSTPLSKNLRNQRDGLTIGNYRNYLYKLYMFLKERCDESNNGYCNPYPREMLMALSRNDLYKFYLGYEYCDDLKALGYIRMQGSGKDKKGIYYKRN